MRTTLARLSVCALLVMAACGDDDGDSASDAVCDSRQDVSSAIDSVRDDLESGNLEDAKDAMSEVQTAFDDLEQSVDDLAEEQRQELQPEIDAVRDDIQALGDVTSLEQLSSAIEGIQTDVQALIDAPRDDLSCS